MVNKLNHISYWQWLFYGSGGKAGIRRLLNRWLFFHIMIGMGLTFIVPLKLQDCANVVLLPLAGIIIGLAFAWGGNAQALLQTSEIDELSSQHEGGFVEYVYVYQMAIMVLFMTLIQWALSGLNIFDGVWPKNQSSIAYYVIKLICFTMSSIALRECWHVILGAQWMLLMHREIKRIKQIK